MNLTQQKHKNIDDKICSICSMLVESDCSPETYKLTAEKLKQLELTTPKVRDKLNELIAALEKGSEVNIDICRKEMHWTLVGYRDFYESSENFD